jgi:hypothetical protein
VKRPPPPHLAAPETRRRFERPISRTDSSPPVLREEVVGPRARPARGDDAPASAGAPGGEPPVDLVPADEPPPKSKHDDLLAAFLADAPIDPDPET